MATKSHRHSLGSVSLQKQLYSIPQHQFISKQNGIVDSNTVNVRAQKSTSEKLCVNFQDFQNERDFRNSTDIENSLESLCIQMMEHALGP